MAAAVLLVGSCSTVSYWEDWDTGNDFSGYRSFAWYELPPPPGRSAPPAVIDPCRSYRHRGQREASMRARLIRDATSAHSSPTMTA